MLRFNVFQIGLSLMVFIFLVNDLWKFIKKETGQTIFKVLYKTFIWGGILILTLFPNYPRIISVKLGLGENLSVLIFIGFVLVFMVIFKLLSIIERLERDISKIVREQALDKISKDEYTYKKK